MQGFWTGRFYLTLMINDWAGGQLIDWSAATHTLFLKNIIACFC